MSRKESLSGKSRIDFTFSKGSNIFIYPIKFQFLAQPEKDSFQKLVLFSVSKRYFKKAVDRNLIKRRMREAYRLNQDLLSVSDEKLHLAFIYSAKEVKDFHFIEEKLILGLKRLQEKLFPNPEHDSQKD